MAETPGREERLNEVIAAYLEAAEGGRAPGRGKWLAAHPELAGELAAFLDNHDRLVADAAPLRAAAPPPDPDATLPPAAVAATLPLPPAAPLGTVRYFGDYELLEEIARGGMGVVFRARQVSLNRTVALKMILAGQLSSAADVARFRAEAEAAANLDHPHIVPIYEVGEHAGQQYFSMKLVDGGSLADRLAAPPRPPARDLVRLLVPVCRAVHFAHQRGILHRDLKPGNVLLDAAGTPYVTDFGLAKRVEGDSRLTQSGAIVGTPAYMPPEQAAAVKTLTTAADVYALGAILYEMLAGRPPFRGDTPLDTLLQVIDREPPRPRAVNPAADRDLETVALKCLAKEPAKRYASADALADDLDRWLRGEPILARPATAAERAWKWAKRRPAAAGLVSVVLVGVISAASAAVWFTSQLKHERDVAQAEKVEADRQRALATQQERTARRNLYLAHMHLARQAWEATDAGRLQELLDRQVPSPDEQDFRGWEWHYFRSQSRALLKLHGHKATIRALAWSPDGTRLASGSGQLGANVGELKVWDSVSGQELAAAGDRIGYAVTTVAWSPDGEHLASGGEHMSGFQNTIPGDIPIWNAKTGRKVIELRGHLGSVNSVAWSPDGRRLASAGGNFGPPGQAKVWDVATGRALVDLPGHGNQVNSVAWTPDGQRLASASTDGTIKIWDATTGQEIRTLRGRLAVRTAHWSPNGRRLASTAADGVNVWDTDTGRAVWTLPAAPLVSAIWRSDSDHVSVNYGDAIVKTWNVSTNKEVETINTHVPTVGSVVWSPDGRRLALASGDQTIHVRDIVPVPEALVLRGEPTPVASVAWSPDGARLVATGSGVQIWEVSTWRKVYALPGPPGGGVFSASWSPDGRRLVSVGTKRIDAIFQIWDTTTGQELHTWNAHVLPDMAVAWNPDGRQVASGGADRAVRLWDAGSWKLVHKMEGHTGSIHKVVWSRDGQKLASAGDDNTVRIWNTASGQETMVLRDSSGGIRSAAWSPDGRSVASGGVGFKIWEADTGKELLTLHGHTAPVAAVAWSPDQAADRQRLASVSADGTLKLWDVATGQEVLTLKASKDPFISVAWSPDGQQLGAGTSDGTVKVWTTAHVPVPAK
jgi:WD40 repeat protein